MLLGVFFDFTLEKVQKLSICANTAVLKSRFRVCAQNYLNQTSFSIRINRFFGINMLTSNDCTATTTMILRSFTWLSFYVASFWCMKWFYVVFNSFLVIHYDLPATLFCLLAHRSLCDLFIAIFLHTHDYYQLQIICRKREKNREINTNRENYWSRALIYSTKPFQSYVMI